MGNIDWKNLEIIEEWPTIGPNDREAVEREKFRIRLLSSLILKAYYRHKHQEALKNLKKLKKSQRVRMRDRSSGSNGGQTAVGT